MLISPAPSGIAVQLNGEALTFTDAVPVAQDGRTFLPFRAVFEAMGAEAVSYTHLLTTALIEISSSAVRYTKKSN